MIFLVFSRDEATIRARVRPTVRRSVGPSVCMSVMLLLFGLLGATYAVYTALFTKASPTDGRKGSVFQSVG